MVWLMVRSEEMYRINIILCGHVLQDQHQHTHKTWCLAWGLVSSRRVISGKRTKEYINDACETQCVVVEKNVGTQRKLPMFALLSCHLLPV